MFYPGLACLLPRCPTDRLLPASAVRGWGCFPEKLRIGVPGVRRSYAETRSIKRKPFRCRRAGALCLRRYRKRRKGSNKPWRNSDPTRWRVSSLLQIAKRSKTGRTTALGEHTAPHYLCAALRLGRCDSCYKLPYRRVPRLVVDCSDPPRELGSPVPNLVQICPSLALCHKWSQRLELPWLSNCTIAWLRRRWFPAKVARVAPLGYDLTA
jgi:hypothetical protein